MSSRRKSRPVRRLDARCGEVDGTVISGEQSREHSLSPLCGDTENSNQIEKQDDCKKTAENPPEGVYILEPQGFSDDDDNDKKANTSSSSGYENDKAFDHKENGDRKRLRINEDSHTDRPINFHGSATKDGLDLSVKRRKTEEDCRNMDSEADTSLSSDIARKSSTEASPGDLRAVDDLQTNMKRYEKLLRLLAQRRPLMESMQEVGLTQQDLVMLQRFRFEMMERGQMKQEICNEGYDHSKLEATKTSSTLNTQIQNEALDNWQDGRKKPDYEEDDTSFNIPKPVFSSANFPPVVAAAVMASLVASSDQSKFLQSNFRQTPDRQSQGSRSSPLTPPSTQYSTSADAMDTITAGTVSSGVGSIKRGTLDPTNFDEDVFDKYITKFTSKYSCMQSHCPHVNRDHYHCTDSDCNFQRFTNKSDVIRHYNMHKKRDNSLAHGFMRFAPSDNCFPQFGNCHFKGKSTHYHCLHTNCTKVYTSTSDVMTHENFHKKNQQFVTNGFQRYRATEPCGTDYCPFSTQRTTHFHCTRSDCNFTFKNKCDIEKHKSYHMRDDAYTRQGFKKFYKNEPCQFPSCAWNRTANHFHCLRENCDFSFTSTSQMVSHKRKHDRQELMVVDTSSTISSASSSSVSSILPQVMSPLATLARFPRQIAPTFVRAPVTPYLGVQGQRLPPLPFLSPFVTASLINRPMPSIMFESHGSNSSKFDASLYHETARNVVANIPSTIAAAALPRNLTEFTSKMDSNDKSSFLPTAISPATTNDGENGFSSRNETSLHNNDQFDRPPPPYMGAPDTESTHHSPQYDEHDHYDGESSETDNDGRVNRTPMGTAHHSPLAIMGEFSQNHQPESVARGESQALNLSSRNSNSDETQERKNLVSDPNPTSAVLKYFTGFSPDECIINSCVLAPQHHFHCVVQDCCAVFTDKHLVLNHTMFHEKLDRFGITQITSQKYSPLHRSISRRENSYRNVNSPPPGYIALPVTSRAKEEHRTETEPQNTAVTRRRDCESPESRDSKRPDSADYSIQKVGESMNIPRTGNIVYDYITRMIQDKAALGSHTGLNRACDNTAYLTLQGKSTMGAIAGKQPPQISNTEGKEAVTGNNNFFNDGYLHIRQGMTCTRQDCKYVMQNHWHCTLNRCRYVCKSLGKAQTHRQAHDSLEAYARAAKECFKSYTVKKNCPNINCEFRLRGHYHCLKPGCQFVTIGTSKLPWHMKKHEKIAKREASGFKYFTKKEQCGKHECKYNSLFSHYHCIRAGCAFAFQYKHQMSTHVRKHLRRMLGRSYNGTNVHHDADVDHTNVDSGDDSLPLIVDEADELEQRPGVAPSRSPLLPRPNDPTSQLSPEQLAVLEQISRGIKTSLAARSEDRDLSSSQINESSAIGSINGYDTSSEDEVLDLRAGNAHDTDSNSLGSGSAGFSNDQPMLSEDEKYSEDARNCPHSLGQENNISSFLPSKFERSDVQASFFNKFKLNNDVMDGFRRFESSENCGDLQCSYMCKVSHYHCLHDGCSYRFTGRTHMFKHHQHHERVAGLVRDDFKRYKPTQSCNFPECQLNGLSTHFHCLRCAFKCTDSAKVGTHRRQHVKADTLEQWGFERLRGKDDCLRESCKYRQRNTSHFHCLQPGCSYTVVGLSGIEQHYNKHKMQTSVISNNSQINLSLLARQFLKQSSELPLASNPIINSHSYTFPLNAVSSTSTASGRSSGRTSPVKDEQRSASNSPAFNNSSVPTSQFNSDIQETTQVTSVDLTGSRNMSINDCGVGAIAGVSL